MAFSLSNWFKSKSPNSDEETEGEAPAPEQAHAPAPPSVRTVTPSAPQNAPKPTIRPPVTLTATKLPTSGKVTPVLPAARKVSFAPGTAVTAETAPPPVAAAPAPAFAPTAPNVTVSLEVGDFLDRLPAAFLQSGSFDRSKKVEFQASELYSDLSKGRASVPASVIYHRCPEIFSRPVTETEDVEVQLPLRKLVEQMGTALSTRQDQVEEENVGEIETPFLQVAMEDNARLPTAVGSAIGAVRPLAPPKAAAPAPSGEAAPTVQADGVATTRPHRTGQISTISPVKVPAAEAPLAPPTAATASPIIAGKRPPSTVRASVAGGKIRLSGPTTITRIAAAGTETPTARPGTHSQRISLPVPPAAGVTASPSHQVTKKTARIQIPPISLRTGGPNATPRPGVVPAPPTGPEVGLPGTPAPAPGGGPMPSFRPTIGKEGAPTISFRTSPPPPSAKPIPSSFAPPRAPAFPPPAFPAAAPAAPAVAAPAPAADDRKIELGLSAILRSLPSTMLAVEPSAVPDDVRIALPFALIEPQLSQGRVTIGRAVFVQALPESHRAVLSGDNDTADISLPLQEVFQHLPTNALSIRNDQVAEETGAHYPTPFSQKADEDAQRLGSPKAVPASSASDDMAGVPAAQAAEPVFEDKQAATEAAAPVSEPSNEADTVTDVPLDTLRAPAPSDETELRPTPKEELTRDTPLDQETSPVAPEAPAASEATAEKTTEAPIESRDIDLGKEPDLEGEPVEKTPLPELPSSDAAPVSHDAITEPPVAEAPVVAPETKHDLPPLVLSEPPAAAVIAPPPAPAKPAPAAVVHPIPAQDGVLQTLFMTEDAMDAKTVVKLVCQLPAVDGCAVMFEDGLRLAGNFPGGNTEGFSAMAAPFYKRAVRFVSELDLGGLQTFTLHTENGLLSFFMHDNICVSVHHAGRGFMPGVREKLEIVTRELARMYATAKPAADTDPSV